MRESVDQAAPLRNIKELFASYPRRYWIAGGWAVDLCVGRVRREHADVDVMILIEDLPALAKTFEDRQMTVTDHQTGVVTPWDPDAEIEPGRHTLGLLDEPHLEMVLALSDGDEWIFHRGRKVRRELVDITRVSPGGLPFVSPEILLLFKSRGGREKDDQDFRDLAGLLTPDQVQWLVHRLSRPGASDHPWLSTLHALNRP